MKRALLIAVAAISTPAFAQVSDTETVAFSGTVAVRCEVTDLDQAVSFGALGPRGQASAVTDADVDIFCNQRFTPRLTSQNGYLKLSAPNDPGAVPTGETNLASTNYPTFDAGIDYTAAVPAFGIGVSTADLTANTPQSFGLQDPTRANNINVRYDTITSNQPLLGGTYNDTLTLTLTPTAF